MGKMKLDEVDVDSLADFMNTARSESGLDIIKDFFLESACVFAFLNSHSDLVSFAGLITSILVEASHIELGLSGLPINHHYRGMRLIFERSTRCWTVLFHDSSSSDARVFINSIEIIPTKGEN